MKTQRYYRDRAAYMRDLARKAQTEALQKSCLKAARDYEALAAEAAKTKPGEDQK